MRTELVKTPLTECWTLLRKEWKAIIWGLVKIYLLIIGAALSGGVLLVAGALLLSTLSPVAAIAFAVILGIPLILVIQAIDSISYNFIDAAWSKKPMSYSETFQRNLLPVSFWAIAVFLIKAAVAIPFFALLVLSFMGGGGQYGEVVETLGEVLFRILLSVALALVDLFIQFAIFEIVLSRSKVLDGFGRSISLVRKNLAETALFSFVLWVIELVIAVPLTILIFVLVFGGLLGLAIPGIGILVLVLMAIVAIPVAVLMSALTHAVTITAQYRYWSKARVGR